MKLASDDLDKCLDNDSRMLILDLAKKLLKRREQMQRYHTVNLDTFKEVLDNHDATKPIISKNHSKADDLRPIWVRQRKWERSIKVSDNKVILNDGSYDKVEFWHYYNSTSIGTDHKDYYNRYKPSLKVIERTCPILWKKDRKGNEFVRVRNGSGMGAHSSRYSFLENMLPLGLRFLIENGKQYVVRTRSTKTYDYMSGVPQEAKHFIPKSNYNPAFAHDFYPNDTTMNRSHYKWGQIKDDHKYLWFKRVDPNKLSSHPSGWELCGSEYQFIPAKMRVNKSRKEKLRPHIERFYSYVCAMYPLILTADDGNNYNSYHSHSKTSNDLLAYFREYRAERGLPEDGNGRNLFYWDWSGKSDFVEHVIKTQEHEALQPLAEYYIRGSDLRFSVMDEEMIGPDGSPLNIIDNKKVRNQFNSFINKALELTKRTSEDKVRVVK
jgi:hypothetical protein